MHRNFRPYAIPLQQGYNLRKIMESPEMYAIPIAVPLDSSAGVKYQAVNLVADDPGQLLWPEPRTAADIYQNGVYVQFSYPNEIQYLLLKKMRQGHSEKTGRHLLLWSRRGILLASRVTMADE